MGWWVEMQIPRLAALARDDGWERLRSRGMTGGRDCARSGRRARYHPQRSVIPSAVEGSALRRLVDNAGQLTRRPTNQPTIQLTNSPTHQLTNSPTHQLTNSPTHQLTNSPTHQLTNSLPLVHAR